MNSVILHIENKRSELIEFLEELNSKRAKLFYLYNFLSVLFTSGNKQLINSYLSEFIDDYFDLVAAFDPFCIDPKLTENIISQSYEVLNYRSPASAKEQYTDSINSLEQKLNDLKKYLSGGGESISQGRFYFPLLEENQNIQNNFRFGLIESVSVQIKKADDKNSFNIIPSERELEQRIKHQVETSWNLAVAYAAKHIRKLSPYHDVIISFDNKSGIVEGNSSGAALTLTFIKELLKLYNASIFFTTPADTAYTGGQDTDGIITSVSGEIIKAKTEAVFFSGIKTFALPALDVPAAQEKLNELKERFPDRRLRVTGIEDFEDLINRRNLVEIKKINPIVRGGKFALRHSLSIILTFILAGVILLSGLLDFDDNPATLAYENQHLKVYNKNNKLLWSEKINPLSELLLTGQKIKKQYAVLTDVTGDGKNEIVLSNKLFGPKMHDTEYNNIVCYDFAKKLVWKHTFAEVVSTNTITFSSEYRTKFIDIIELNNRRILLVIAKNFYYPSAVFGIDIATGELATEVFWHSGHLDDGIIQTDSASQNDKLIFGGVNNGFESACLVVVDINNLGGQALAPANYKLNNIPEANLLEYILIPPTDYSFAKNSRYNCVSRDQLTFEDTNIRVGTNEEASLGESGPLLYYYFNPDFTISFIETGDSFQHQRDKLVKEGKLTPPLTYTAEYFEILKNNIKYWDGEKFVNYVEYFEKNN